VPIGEDEAGNSDSESLHGMLAGATEETPDLPWDEASCADDPPTVSQPVPCYNLCPARGHFYDHRLASNMNASSGTKSYDPHVQLLQLASNNMETCPGDMFSYIFGFTMNQMTAS